MKLTQNLVELQSQSTRNAIKDVSVTTLEIAELTGKRHDNILADTKKMLVELYSEVNLLKFQENYKDTKNREYPMYRLPKKEALCLASKYGAKYYDIIDNKLSENKQVIASNSDTITSFSFENYNLDYGILNGEPVFNLNSIASYLSIANPRTSIDVDDTDYVIKINPIVGFTYNRKIHNTGELFLTEAGLYRLILRSNKPQAEKFSKWVTKEVLPSIRKNGGYIANQENLTPEQIVANALIVAQNIIAERDKTIVEQKQVIEYQGNKLDNYKQIELQRRYKQELATSLNRNIRLLAEQKFNRDYGSAYTYIYSKFADLHCINEKINIEFLKKNNDYLAECLSIVLSELD